ncbi:Membrane-bound ClpP-class protease [Planctomycetales bacterium 10988]|nr:Membrane-bound ClpP-class protease [Planctomycetales bacterium 10988]
MIETRTWSIPLTRTPFLLGNRCLARPSSSLICSLFCVLLALPCLVHAENAEPAEERTKAATGKFGKFITVAAPLTDQVDRSVRRQAREALQAAKLKGEWPTLVFVLEAGSSELGKTLDLAKYLSSPALQGATTIAYIPEQIEGHQVLLALACEQILMAPDARMGLAGKDEASITPDIVSIYQEIAGRRRTVPEALVLGMLDPKYEVWQVESPMGSSFVLKEDLEAAREEGAVAEEIVIPAGEAVFFTGAEARTELGFVQRLASSRQEVASALNLSRESLEETVSIEDDWLPVRIDLQGPLTEKRIRQAQSMLETARREKKNFICFWIDSDGGDPAESLSLAGVIASLNPSEVRTVAYIPRKAHGDAVIPALACDRIVLGTEASFGGPGDILMTDEDLPSLNAGLKDIAEKKFRSPRLCQSLIDPSIELLRFEKQLDDLPLQRFGTKEEQEAWEADGWKVAGVVVKQGELLQLTGQEAMNRVPLAWETAESFGDFKRLFGLERDPTLIEPGWIDTLVEALAHPAVATFLFILGFTAIWTEFQTPGLGVGWLLGGICFLLFFWSHYLGGSADWLEILLFIAGAFCLVIEIFILPGFGIFGLTGGLLMLSSIILASQTFLFPADSYELKQTAQTMLSLMVAGVGSIAAVVLLQKVLPYTPYYNRLVLTPPESTSKSMSGLNQGPSAEEQLIHQVGKAVTRLAPSGKARIGKKVYQVMAEGEFVEKGTEVRVLEVRGSTIVVRSQEA